ncbi:MAG TPA: acetyl-CoA carboxylase biotin carboxylase subunit [Polyangiaceae bacterium LLY-WYZ-14_1]|nr:acetyl-CoA carboxylase biotin carboxylase subunit [Polyangiaceae bacterium LLY-WYZ-14_1]
MIRKVLIANRGEIALRVIRTCRELGIGTVAVHSQADAAALHVRFADEAVCIGPADATKSYLHVPSIIAAAEVTNADAIHPGYGFLSENAEFAEVAAKCNLTFIGPRPEDMRQWGDKVESRALAKRLGLPLMEGSGVLRDADHAAEEAARVGLPVMLKASGGGGGRGMKVIRTAEEMRRIFPQAQAEAVAGFKNGDLYCERFVEEPRHIEFQVLCDGRGGAWVLGERECSIQRRHQKIVEEAPSVAVSQELRQDMGATIRRALLDSGYVSAGTLEFLMDERGDLAFMEMNTRIQVEHPVTEETFGGIDLIAQQIRVAQGQEVTLPPGEARPQGHALEVRVNAEDPDTYAPSPGLITGYVAPGGQGVRVDSGVYAGFRVPGSYDSLLAKIITFGPDRSAAIRRMSRALAETAIEGIRTNLPLHRRIMANDDFLAGRTSTRFLERLKQTAASS